MGIKDQLLAKEIERMGKRLIRNQISYMSYNAVVGLGLVGSLSYSFNEVNNYLSSGKELDLFNLACSGICVGLAAVANCGSVVVLEKQKVNFEKLQDLKRGLQ